MKPETVVLISLIPTANTRMENITAPSIEAITGLISEAVDVCKGSEVSLGCMRSREYKTELEWAAIEAGVTRIAMASRSTEKKAVEAGYKVLKLDSCCATPRRYDERLLRV